MTDLVIPAWAWGIFTILLAAGLTAFGSILRAYTGSVDDQFKDLRKRTGKNEQDIAVLKVVRNR